MFNFIKNLFFKQEPTRLLEEIMPETFEEAVDYVYHRIYDNTVNQPGFHHIGGMAIRNNLGLWNENSSLYQHMVQRFGLCHADDTGTLISKAADARQNNRYYNPEYDAQEYRTYWIAQGYNPATMEKNE